MFQWHSISHLPVVLHHDVTVVSVTDAQNESGHTIASAGSRKQVDGHVVPINTDDFVIRYLNRPLKNVIKICYSHLALVFVL